MNPAYSDPLVTLYLGDCLDVMRELPDASVDSVVTDPPYGLSFMGKEWDSFGVAASQGGEYEAKATYNHVPRTVPSGYMGKGRRGLSISESAKTNRAQQAWHEQWATEAFRVLKPGGYLLAFGGTRTYHRLVAAIEDAGFEIRDTLMWIYACLSDDTEILTCEGWVPYNRASEGKHAAAFDPATGELRWERIEAVHVYDHTGYMVEIGPSLVTGNHRVVLSSESQVPLPSGAELRRLWSRLRDLGPLSGDASQDLFPDVHAPALVGATVGQDEAARGAQGSDGDVRDVRRGVLATYGVATSVEGSLLLQPVQREASHSGSPVPSESDDERSPQATALRVHEGVEELGLEGRRYSVQEARELLWSALRAGSGVGTTDGPEGRVRDGASAPDGRPVRVPIDANGSGQPREPRPDGQSSRELDALARQPDPQALRVRQGDRGDVLPSGDPPRLVDYAGVVWCITVPSGAFVARRGGVAFVTGNSGFPKSLNVETALRSAGNDELADKYRGFGTATKPAHEPIVMARKPLVGTVAANVARYGTGALNIDGTRIPGAEPYAYPNGPKGNLDPTSINLPRIETPVESHPAGRWPSNVLLSDPELFDEPNPWVVGSGATVSSGKMMPTEVRNKRTVFGQDAGDGYTTIETYGDSGGYSRFFIIPKADRAERERGLVGATEHVDIAGLNTPEQRAARGRNPDGIRSRANVHPTVKPIDLMRHLVRLITPPGGVVLDPFLGSGTTALAASEEGFRCIGVEREAEYLSIAKGRLMATPMGLGLDVPAPTRKRAAKWDDAATEKRKAAGWNPREAYGRTWVGRPPSDEEDAA